MRMIQYTMHLFVQLRIHSSRSLKNLWANKYCAYLQYQEKTTSLCPEQETRMSGTVQTQNRPECYGILTFRVSICIIVHERRIHVTTKFAWGSRFDLGHELSHIWNFTTLSKCDKVVCILRCWEEFDQWLYEPFVNLASSNMFKVEISALQASLMSHSSKL